MAENEANATETTAVNEEAAAPKKTRTPKIKGEKVEINGHTLVMRRGSDISK